MARKCLLTSEGSFILLNVQIDQVCSVDGKLNYTSVGTTDIQ